MELINIIEQFESKCLTPFTVKNIQNEIIKRVGINYPKSILYKIMKSECSLSFKRICSRPKRYKSAILLPSRSLFWTKFLYDLTQETQIINIDETIFNRNWKTNYSWGLRGDSKEWQNEIIVNSINMIFALCSNGWWMSLTTNESINSK